MPDYDVLIVGAGPIGAALALALRAEPLSVGLLEARGEDSAARPRPIALSHGSRLLLERLGVWEPLASATPIERIHVSQRGGFGRLVLDARDVALPALGYVVDYAALAQALARALAQAPCGSPRRAAVAAVEPGTGAARVRFESERGSEEAAARLVVVADGGALALPAPLCMRDYRQAAVGARVGASLPHRNVAYERFTPEGPLALLPSGEALALIWTVAPARARELCAMPEAQFLDKLQRAFGRRAGAFTAAAGRDWFPLALRVAPSVAGPRVVAVGNAAQTLHPVAGQGLNLGLRDAWELAEILRECEPGEIGAPAQLAAYRRRRRLDRGAGVWFTDALVRLFSNDIAPLRLARGAGLALLGAVPPAREFLMRRMIFGARG